MAPAPLNAALAGQLSAPPSPPPEITAFEVPEGAPTWGFEVLDFSVERELPRIKSFVDRTSALALAAGRLALADARLLERDRRPPGAGIGCAYGTTLGCLEAMAIFWNKIKASNPRFAQPLPFTHGYANSPSSLLCIEYALKGPAATFSGERLAGIEALLFAFDQLAAGAGDIILAGASESLTPAAYNHLLATGQLSRTGNWEDGVIPGEGAAMLVLESAASAARRNVQALAEITGVELWPSGRRGALEAFPEAAVFGPARCERPRPAKLFSCELFTGELLSAAPVLGALLAAGALGGRYAAGRLPRPATDSPPAAFSDAVVVGIERDGTAGAVMLRRPAER